MAKIISQTTFDDVVKENVVEFSMTTEEAREEAIVQFEAQGVNLANIIKDLSINDKSGKPVLNESIDGLKAHLSGEKRIEIPELISHLTIIETECKKSVPHRVLAGKNDAHEVLINILEQELSSTEPNKEVILTGLNAANALVNKQPDIFDAEALAVTIKILNKHTDIQLLSGALQWISKACILHERNRRNIIGADILKYLKPLMQSKDAKLIRDICAVFRYLTLDDDIRAEVSDAHEHARLIASEFIVDLTKLLSEFDDVNVISDIFLTIASLTVRQELCLAVEEAGGVQKIFDIIVKYPDALKVNRDSLKLLKALSGHDAVRRNIVQQGAAPIITSLLNTHKATESLASAALACIASLTLRIKENSAAFFEAGVPEVIAETMRLHPSNKIIQRNSAWAIRNMVSRSRDQCETFLSHDVETLLNAALKAHPSIGYDVKAALRDLGCNVELKEEWTGTSKIKMAN